MTGPEPIPETIAIVGVAGRFPGARDVTEFWQNLIAGKDCITHFTDEQLAATGYDPKALRALPGFVAARGVVEKPDWFDRGFFGIPPKEAEVMDPQQRVFLEIAWDALEDAGCDPSRYPGLIGVFAGMSNNTYYPYFVRQRRDLLEAVGIVSAVIANEKDFLTTRLAYKLNLRGPALNVQTACSSSLVAVCVACQNLLEHQCDVALAGGVSLTFPQDRGYFYQEGGMTSADGRCAPFDVAANGTIFSSGAGVVALKRLSDAIADGDQIYAVIKGQALNNDGSKKVSFAAPSVDGHTEVISLAQAVAGVSPESISYIEAHGTATPLGDPIEIAGLTQVFRTATDRTQFCPIGSVKGNIGHLDAASGVASLIKAALAMRHGQIPPSIQCDSPNPALHLEESPFFINTTLRDWPRGASPRRAGVSSFGVGGTNAHVILEEAPEFPPAVAARAAQALIISAKTATALDQRARDLATHLQSHPDAPLTEVAFTLQTGRQHFQHRRAIVARTSSDAATALLAPTRLQRVQDRTDVPVAFLFPGQGSQYPRMGARLYASEPVFRAALDECAELLHEPLALNLRELLFSDAADSAEKLRETRFTQPAIFATSYALARLWLSLGIRPAILVGHSVGEFVAATIAGIFSTADAARLVAARAQLVQDLPRGAMLAVRLAEADAREFLADPSVAIAAINSPRLCVLSGPIDAIEKIEATLTMRNVAARRLATSHAFHSPMVEPVVAPFLEAVRHATLHAPTIPIVSTVTGELLTAAQATDPRYWADHLRATVRFADATGKVLADPAGYALLESGPGMGLTQLATQHTAKTARSEIFHSIAEDSDENDSIATALARLWLAGAPVEWERLHATGTRRVSLPGYPFERQRYFADLPAGVPMPITTAATDGEAPVDSSRVCSTPCAAATAHDDAPQLSSTKTAAQKDGTADELKQLLAELSGLDLSEVAPSAGLLELGFDSLFLSQAALTISRRFGVKVSFRQLLQDTSTIESLAAHIDRERPLAQDSQPAPTPITPAPTSVSATTPHGPFRPVQRDLGARLGDRQQRWLDDFIARYTARTAKSKRHTQENRAHFADPRAVSGFKQAWKEIVYPIVVERSSAARLWDLDDNEWTDLTLSYGAAMLGHQPDFVVRAITDQLALGMEIGPTSPLAGEVAKLICDFTGMERATFCNSGSEAVTGALRIARTVTGRPRFVYFTESYHGIDNEVLGRRAGANVLPIAPGIPVETMANALILDYGDPRALEAIATDAANIAAVLVEPVQSRRPGFQPREFLHELRALTAKHGIALIFDEVITGFRCHPGGAQAHFSVQADIATYGKVIGGGLPIGAIAGRAEYMDAFDGGAWNFGDDSFPGAAVTFFAGTFVRHPLALASARAVLTHMRQQGPALQQSLGARADAMTAQINTALAGTPFTVANFTSNWLTHTAPDFKYSSLLYALLRHRGFHIWEGRPCFVSTAHSDADLENVARAFAESAAELEDAGFLERTKPAVTLAPGTLALTEGQREVWLVCQQSPTASTAFNETWTVLFDGPLDVAAMRAAVGEIVARHDALRCTFSPSGETLTVAPHLALEVPLVDLSSFTAEERDARFAALRRAESARVFDLQHGPLLAPQIVKLDAEKHAFVFSAHHLACDGWSCDVFLHELAAIYSARRESSAHQLSAATQMSDFARWEREMHSTSEFADDAKFWLENFKNVPPALDLPGDRPYPSWRNFHGSSEALVLPAELPPALVRLGAQHGATLFTVLLAAFKTLLHRHTEQRDLVVGVPSAGQNLMGGEHLIGHCVNMLPMRSQLGEAATFAALLKDLQSTVLEAFEHQRVTFGWLLQKLSLPRVPGRVPLAPVTFNLDPPLSTVRFAGLQHRLEANPRTAYQFDLGFNCDTVSGSFRVVCNFNTDIFDAATVRRLLDEYRAILAAAVADPAMPLAKPAESQSPGESAPRVELWPSSPSAGAELLYDDLLYNAMTLDKSRHDCYRRAFAKVARDKIVVDIGTGRDALLARMCVEAGARKVYAIEILERPAKQAQELIRKLQLEDRITVIHGRSQDVRLPELADICLSENVGHIGGAEGGDVLLQDSLRFLKPGGLIIPGRCLTKIAAISMPEEFLRDPAFEELGAYYARQTWQQVGYRHDFRLCVTNTSRAMLRSSEDIFEEVDFAKPPAAEYRRDIQLAITRTGRIDGFLLWLRLETVPGETLEAIDQPDSWLPVYLPVFDPPIEVSEGDRIEAAVHGALAGNGMNRDYRIAGRVLRRRGGDREFSFDSWHYRQSYKATPFYQRLFSEDSIRISRPAASERIAPLPNSVLELVVPEAPSSDAAPAFLQDGVHCIFEEQVRRAPDAAAIVDADARVSYRELNARANQLARRLRASGVERGATVGICLERSIAFVVAALATLKAGAAYVPLDPALPDERLNFMLRRAGAANVIAHAESATVLTPAGAQLIDPLDPRLASESTTDLDLPHSGEDLAYVMFTSGSTGQPKGAAIPHRAIARLVLDTDYVQLTPDDVVAHASTVAFDAATFEIWGALLTGARLVITSRETLLSAPALRSHFAAHGVTTLFLTTALFNQLARSGVSVFASLKHLLFGGEATDSRAVELVLANDRPRRLLNVYGPTEATTFATWHEIKHIENGVVPIGKPIANTTLFLLDGSGKPVDKGAPGEIHLGGPGLAREYVGEPALTAERFVATKFGRLYRTGDLARMLPDGVVEFIGRADRQIKLRGFRIELGEVELALQHHPSVQHAAVVEYSPNSENHAIHAFFVSAPGAIPDEPALREFLASRVPDYMIPSRFVRLDRMPLNANGKTDYAALPQSAQPDTRATPKVSPRNAIEVGVAQLWEEVLGRNSFSVHDDFFTVGGHSFRAIQLLAKVREKFSVDVPVRVLFETPTIEGTAAYLAAHLPPPAVTKPLLSLVPIQRGDDRERPFFLVSGGWGGEIEFLVYAKLAREMDPAQPLYGLKARGSEDNGAPHANVSEMARDYVEEIRTRQPRGPYMLGGECVGGVVAYEIACLLEAAGEKVDLLVLLDTQVPSPTSRAIVERAWQDLRAQQRANFWKTRVESPLRDHLKKLAQLSLTGQMHYLWQRIARTHRPRSTGVEQMANSYPPLADYPKTVMRHNIRPYSGKVTLLLDQEAHTVAGSLGWDEVPTGGLEVHVLPGDHLSYIREDAKSAAAKLNELINRAKSNSVC